LENGIIPGGLHDGSDARREVYFTTVDPLKAISGKKPVPNYNRAQVAPYKSGKQQGRCTIQVDVAMAESLGIEFYQMVHSFAVLTEQTIPPECITKIYDNISRYISYTEPKSEDLFAPEPEDHIQEETETASGSGTKRKSPDDAGSDASQESTSGSKLKIKDTRTDTIKCLSCDVVNFSNTVTCDGCGESLLPPIPESESEPFSRPSTPKEEPWQALNRKLNTPLDDLVAEQQEANRGTSINAGSDAAPEPIYNQEPTPFSELKKFIEGPKCHHCQYANKFGCIYCCGCGIELENPLDEFASREQLKKIDIAVKQIIKLDIKVLHDRGVPSKKSLDRKKAKRYISRALKQGNKKNQEWDTLEKRWNADPQWRHRMIAENNWTLESLQQIEMRAAMPAQMQPEPWAKRFEKYEGAQVMRLNQPGGSHNIKRDDHPDRATWDTSRRDPYWQMKECYQGHPIRYYSNITKDQGGQGKCSYCTKYIRIGMSCSFCDVCNEWYCNSCGSKDSKRQRSGYPEQEYDEHDMDKQAGY
jgi:hypothetical protein